MYCTPAFSCLLSSFSWFGAALQTTTSRRIQHAPNATLRSMSTRYGDLTQLCPNSYCPAVSYYTSPRFPAGDRWYCWYRQFVQQLCYSSSLICSWKPHKEPAGTISLYESTLCFVYIAPVVLFGRQTAHTARSSCN